LKTKQKQLKLQDKGNKPKRACPPTDEEINILYNRNVEFCKRKKCFKKRCKMIGGSD
jgi:hypothetical protein